MSNKISIINKKSIAKIRLALKTKLKSLEEELGIEIEFRNCSFDTDTIKFSNVIVKVQGALDEDAKGLEEVKSFNGNIDFDKVASVNGRWFKIVGFKRKATKNNWVILDTKTNEKFVVPMTFLLRDFAKDKELI